MIGVSSGGVIDTLDDVIVNFSGSLNLLAGQLWTWLNFNVLAVDCFLQSGHSTNSAFFFSATGLTSSTNLTSSTG